MSQILIFCVLLGQPLKSACVLSFLRARRPDVPTEMWTRIMFVGEDVGGMKKGRAALQKNAVFGIFEGASAGDHVFNSLSDLREAAALR